ncbi:MAG: IS30 family transposase [Dysgonamonadaceae bacterium]|nr:IS30 family transposase [Dysgonamonadaceae bacterium]
MNKNKYLTMEERSMIKSMLDQSASFKEIGRRLDRDCTTISKEVRNHLIYQKQGCFGQSFHDCANRFHCPNTKLCSDSNCQHTKSCSQCSKCHLNCQDYFKVYCSEIHKPPYVCNGCKKRTRCTLEKRIYSAVAVQQEYLLVRSEVRSGICISEEEALSPDAFLSPLIQKGQSIHHICTSNPGAVMFSEKTIYNYVDQGVFSARNLDLPRKVRYQPRDSKHDSYKVDRSCRIGRTYTDFLDFLEGYPDCPVVQIDSVEGKKGGKVLLTIHFVKAEFMLAFLRDRNTAASVFMIFEKLYRELRPDRFIKLFPVLLGDNGSEFSDPQSIEMDAENNLRTRVFYCDPAAPYQKGAAENNHEFIRRILPKGTSLDELTQEQIDLAMNQSTHTKEQIQEITLLLKCFACFMVRKF